MKNYAQIDENKICVGIYSGVESEDENVIEIAEYDMDLIGRTWDDDAQAWSNDKIPEPIPEPTVEEMIFLNTEYLRVVTKIDNL